ncbi:MAG: hypothetical protein ACLFPU_09050 [Dehalococcoidia bacterium]
MEKAFSSLPDECWAPGATWFIDIGGAPIPYFLGILGYLRNKFPSPQLTIFNPTGTYGEEPWKYSFTSGLDTHMWVPYLWGHPELILPRTYVFLLGFEGERSYEVFYQCEPDRVKALVAKPGYESEYEGMPISRNKLFLEETALSGSSLIEANAADPVETWTKLEQVVAEEKDKSNVVFVPLGPKAHAFGSGLCALTDGAPAVLYHMPRTYRVRDVKRGRHLWKYEISL